ncbi:hypothetical protein Taro_055510 [Colocasia esculenta]|uniref:Uncharacterized protein n=1 Tax=Colocasia esculenta TaxID=4460 RepID=A0A843XR64_COLES|nr:hypothetical protein [Colocasia esculenta]
MQAPLLQRGGGVAALPWLREGGRQRWRGGLRDWQTGGAPEMIREDPAKVSSPGVPLPHCARHRPTRPSQARFFLTDG